MKNTRNETTWKLILVCISMLLYTVPFSEASFSCWAAPVVFGPKCMGTTGIIGHSGYRQTYRVTVTGNAGTLACCEAKGFDPNTNQEKWYSIGCGHENFSGSVPWGNNLATEGVRCKGTPFGVFVSVN